MKKFFSKAFTLIELVIVIIILGILAAIIVPQFRDLSTSAATASQNASEAGVRAAFAIYLGENSGSYPTVTQLAAVTQGGTAAATGVQVTINSQTCTVATYTDTSCSSATAAAGNTVRCVGNISCA